MTTLAELERIGLEEIEERKRRIEEANRVAVEAERQSKDKMNEAVLDCLVKHSGADKDELRPLLWTDREYTAGRVPARLSIPGVRDGVAVIRFECSSRKDPNNEGELVVSIEHPNAPFCFSYRNPTYYATLGEVMAIARQMQARADEYDRVSEEEEKLASERYEQHKAQVEQEKADRVKFISDVLDQHPIVEPLLHVLVAYLDREAVLQDELDAATEF